MFAPRLPSLAGRVRSTAPTDTDDTSLGRAIAKRVRDHPDQCGLHLLRDGKDAFAARAVLAQRAERTLDVQYYIWHNDLSSTLMLEELRGAADRGVRVRLLLDDNGVGKLDETLSALNDHPQVEVRLFNPFVIRRPKHLNYLLDFQRLNRRMHNKSFTADNQATIVGGRNIGDEYFGAREDDLFVDLDVLCLGGVVRQVSDCFDRYWNCDSAYPAERILSPVGHARKEGLAARTAEVVGSPAARDYRQAVEALPLFDEMEEGEVPFTWTAARLISDPPDKAAGRARVDELLAGRLVDALGVPERQLTVISGYFVPTRSGTDALVALARRGVEVRVLTNSYAANDVGFVHAGYVLRRKRLARAGVRLFEMPAPGDQAKTVSKFVRSGGGRGRSLRAAGTTLHAKSFGVDGERLFVGSFNFDPRSIHLNTEQGLVIESADLAREMAERFDRDIVPSTYNVEATADGGLVWIDRRDDDPEPERVEPGTTPASRILVRLLSRLPIEWLL